MTDNDNNQHSVNCVDHDQVASILDLEEERTLHKGVVIAALNACGELWNIFKKKQDISSHLYREQIAIFTRITAMKRAEIDCAEAVIGKIIYTKISEQNKHILLLLEDFEGKLNRSSDIIQDFIQNMRAQLTKLGKELDAVTNAKTVEDLTDIDTPNMDWLESVPDPEMEALADHWDRMQLKRKTTQLLTALGNLIYAGMDIKD